LMENNYIGNQSGQVAAGNHNHNGEYITPTDTTNKWQPKGNYANSYHTHVLNDLVEDPDNNGYLTYIYNGKLEVSPYKPENFASFNHQHTLTQIVGQGYNHNDIIKWDAYTSMWEVGSMPSGGGDLSKSDSNVYFYRPWKIQDLLKGYIPYTLGQGLQWINPPTSPNGLSIKLAPNSGLTTTAGETFDGLSVVFGTTSGTVAAGNHTHSVASPLYWNGNTLSIYQANSTTSGYLSSTDWNTFNNKASTSWCWSNFAPLNHSHYGYATTDWVNNNFSTLGHNHDGSYLSLSGGSLSGGLSVGGNVSATAFYSSGNLVATQSWVSGNYSPLGHTHSGYATESWVSNYFSSISHTHSGYATQSWVSSNYLPLTGGTLEGSLVLDNGGHLTASGGVTGLAINSIYGYTCNNYDGQSGTVSKTFVTNVTINKSTQTINYKDKFDIDHDLTVVTDVSLNVSTATISLDFAGGICIGSNSWSGIYKEGEIHLTMDEFEKLKNNTWQIDPEYLEFIQWKQWKREQENKIKLATEKK